MQDMTTMVVEREIQSGAVSVPLRRRFMGVVAHTLAMVSPGLPKPRAAHAGIPWISGVTSCRRRILKCW